MFISYIFLSLCTLPGKCSSKRVCLTPPIVAPFLPVHISVFVLALLCQQFFHMSCYMQTANSCSSATNSVEVTKFEVMVKNHVTLGHLSI
jgi:hypothetical protein